MDSLILLTLLGYVSQGAALLELEPRALTVLRGDPARLTCSTSQPWDVMVWSLNAGSVLTIAAQHGVLSSNPNVAAVNRSRGTRSSWEFVLKRAERRHQGPVTCDLQNVHRESAELFVQEGGSVAISGGPATALRGRRVAFECRALGWYPEPTLAWRVNGREVGGGGGGVAEHNVSVAVETGGADGLYNLTSELVVKATESGQVECLASVSALAAPLSSSVRLTVVAEVLAEESESECGALVAASAALSAALLLLLLLGLCVVLCYRHRRAKSRRLDVLRIDQSESGRGSVAEATGGKVNMGYAATDGRTDISHSDLTQETHSQMDSLSTHKVPDVVSSGSSRHSNLSLHSQSTVQTDAGAESNKTVRRITTV